MNVQRAVMSLVLLFLVSCMFSSAFAADGEQTYLVAYAKFKPGKAPEALKIIHEHFWPVDKKVGRWPDRQSLLSRSDFECVARPTG